MQPRLTSTCFLSSTWLREICAPGLWCFISSLTEMSVHLRDEENHLASTCPANSSPLSQLPFLRCRLWIPCHPCYETWNWYTRSYIRQLCKQASRYSKRHRELCFNIYQFWSTPPYSNIVHTNTDMMTGTLGGSNFSLKNGNLGTPGMNTGSEDSKFTISSIGTAWCNLSKECPSNWWMFSRWENGRIRSTHCCHKIQSKNAIKTVENPIYFNKLQMPFCLNWAHAIKGNWVLHVNQITN